MTVTDPYAAAAVTYLKRGVGGPIPLPARRKKAPPEGWTGYDAPYPSGADVHEWSTNGEANHNIALRLVETVIGIDVDAYESKPGAETLAARELELGPLPPTWVSTSRPMPSGIRLFRVPAGRCWADVVGPAVEVIHYGHRYIVAAPSIHPDTGEAYHWIGPDGGRVAGPELDHLPVLPAEWVTFLDRGPSSERSLKASVDDASVALVLSGFADGSPCRWLTSVLTDAQHELAVAVSRHDAGRQACLLVVRAGEQGHVGAVTALGQLQETWTASLASGESRAPDYGEWERMVAGAVAIVTESPTLEADRGCCGSAALDDGSSLAFDPGDDLELASDVSAFWSARPVLSHVQEFARSRVVSPWAMLGVVLARQIVRVRPAVVLPATIGSEASLNLFVALVGVSGQGKGAAESAAGDAVTFGQDLEVATVGSGEGIGHLYAHREKGEVVRDRESVLFTVPEVDNLTALGNRQGSTLLPQLRSAWSGERLGFSYADPAKRLPIPRHTYRMGLVLGVQPGRAGPLLDDVDGGTPQRFVWLPTTDPEAPEVPPPTPPPWKWPGFTDPFLFAPDGLLRLDVPDSIVTLIQGAHRDRLLGSSDALDGHMLLCRLKVAAALCLLDVRLSVSAADWELAGVVLRVSDRTRAGVVRHLATAVKDQNRARALGEAERSIVVSETVSERSVERVSRVISRAYTREVTEGPVPYRKLVQAVASRDREWMDQALDLFVAREGVRIEELEDGRLFHAVGQ